MVGVSAASVHNASCCVENAERVANASKRGSRNARVVCSIALYMFRKTKRSAALQTPRFQRSCSMALIPGKTVLLDNPLVVEPAEKFSSFSANP
jgi:hypothetical protein